MNNKIELFSNKLKNSEKILFTDGPLKHNSLCYTIEDDKIQIKKSVDLVLDNDLKIRIDHNGRI